MISLTTPLVVLVSSLVSLMISLEALTSFLTLSLVNLKMLISEVHLFLRICHKYIYPGCRVDSDCESYHRCEKDKCIPTPGQILLKKVVFSSGECQDCDNSKISTTLFGFKSPGHPEGYMCSFEGNPKTYYNNNKITFDTEISLGSKCWKVSINSLYLYS